MAHFMNHIIHWWVYTVHTSLLRVKRWQVTGNYFVHYKRRKGEISISKLRCVWGKSLGQICTMLQELVTDTQWNNRRGGPQGLLPQDHPSQTTSPLLQPCPSVHSFTSQSRPPRAHEGWAHPCWIPTDHLSAIYWGQLLHFWFICYICVILIL